MSTTTANQTVTAPPAAAARGNSRIASLRSQMLTLISASVALGFLVGLVAWQANVVAYNDYRTIVDEGSVSVDAALRARAAVLDHMAAGATYLQTEGQPRQDAFNRAQQAWTTFNNEARISWRNLSDSTHGEIAVYTAADRAASDYIQQIGAMFSYVEANQTDQARAAFLEARETLNTRLVPAIGGLEAVKVEAMEATYAGASERIGRWRTALNWLAVLTVLVLLAALFAVRRMRYRWSWPIGIALIITAALAFAMQWQLDRASADAEVMVRRAYDNIAGAQGLGALLSQGRALESIAIFDPDGAPQHLESFNQYITLVDQGLCGPTDCARSTFLESSDRIASDVRARALDEQDKLGVPNPPLVANVHFSNQADQLEALRLDYARWLDTHAQLESAVRARQGGEAARLSTSESAAAFAGIVEEINALTATARAEFNTIWQRVYGLSGFFQLASLFFPAAGILAALGISRRRNELFV